MCGVSLLLVFAVVVLLRARGLELTDQPASGRVPWDCRISRSGWLVGVDELYLWSALRSCGIKCSP